MKLRYLAYSLIILWFFITGVQAATNATVNTNVVDTPYLDVNIWYFLVAATGFMLFLSNITNVEQGAPLWAMLAPIFGFPAMYYSSMLSKTTVAQYVNYDGSSAVYIQQTVFHPEFITFVAGIIFAISIVNMFYIWTKRDVAMPDKRRDFDVE